MRKKSDWQLFSKISWMIGFLLVIFGSTTINNQAKVLASATYNLAPYLWTSAITSIIIGAYIALLFLKQLKLKFNLGLFVCVTIPCLTLTLYYPILAFTPAFLENLEFLALPQLLGLTSETIFGVVAGLTLILSLFQWRE